MTHVYSILMSHYKRRQGLRLCPVSVPFRADRERAARITEEIGNLMKEIETLVEEKTKESVDITQMVKDGEQTSVCFKCKSLYRNKKIKSLSFMHVIQILFLITFLSSSQLSDPLSSNVIILHLKISCRLFLICRNHSNRATYRDYGGC